MRHAILTIFAILGLVSCKRAPIHAEPQASALVGKPFPDYALQSAGTGDSLRSKDLVGHPSLVVFWATWCGPCREEIPGLNKLLAHRHSTGLVIHGLSVDENIAAIPLVQSKLAMSYPVGVHADGLFNQLGLVSIPATFVVDSKGVVTDAFSGEFGEEILAKALDQAESAH